MKKGQKSRDGRGSSALHIEPKEKNHDYANRIPVVTGAGRGNIGFTTDEDEETSNRIVSIRMIYELAWGAPKDYDPKTDG